MQDPEIASGIDPEKVEFRWRKRIPKGMITTVAGRPDQGKGLFAVHVAAEVAAAGGKVLYSAAEDSHSLMTVPRLRAALSVLLANDDPDLQELAVNAALDRIILWRLVLPEDEEVFEAFVIQEDIELVVLDPFASHLGVGVKRHSDSIRKILTPMARLMEETDGSILVIEHALKRVPKSGHPLDAIGGSSSGLPAASRAAYILGRDPDDPDRRILAPAKFNVGLMPEALAFELEVVDIAVVGDIPALTVDDEVKNFDPMRLFESKPTGRGPGRPSDKRSAACEWLTTYLALNGATISSKVLDDAKKANMAVKTLRRAADDMEIVKTGGGHGTTWDLPDDVKEMMGVPTTKPTPPSDGQEGPVTASEVSTDPTAPDDGISLEDGLNALLGGDGPEEEKEKEEEQE